MQYIIISSLYIDKYLSTYETDKVIDYLQNLLEYDSSRDAYLKFQNGGNGACSCEAGLLDEKP